MCALKGAICVVLMGMILYTNVVSITPDQNVIDNDDFTEPLLIVCFLIDISGVLAQCPDGWTIFHDSCYFFPHNHLNFFDAEKFCQQEGGYLVHIETREENTFVRSFCSDLKVGRRWIGLTYNIAEGRWLWHGTDISPSFFDWGPHQPDGAKRSNCGALWERHSYQWGDEPCHFLWEPICERPLNSNMEVVG